MSRKPKPSKGFRENPEWTKETFAKATKLSKPTPLAELGEIIVKSPGRPKLDNPKVSITLRLDAQVVSAYRGTGKGWQSRINADLGRSAKKLKAG